MHLDNGDRRGSSLKQPLFGFIGTLLRQGRASEHKEKRTSQINLKPCLSTLRQEKPPV